MKNKKIVIEIILIPLCIGYLLYTLLNNNPKISLIILGVFITLTSLEFIIKNLKEVYIYESKNNLFKITFAVFNILLLLSMFLTLIYKLETIKILFITEVLLLLIYLFYYGINSVIKIIKDKKPIYKYIIRAFFSLISFITILETFIIYLK